jgi:hypothetical protein
MKEFKHKKAISKHDTDIAVLFQSILLKPRNELQKTGRCFLNV